MDHSLSTFLCGCARYRDFVFFAKSLDELAKDDVANSTFLFVDGERTARFGEPVGWTALSMAVIKEEGRLVVCALGPNGELWEGMPADGASTTGTIGRGGFAWRRMATIGGQVLACGMGRTVALRTGALTWTDIGPPPPKGDRRVLGFEGIDGTSPNDLYAVGWGGELWRRRKGRWRQLESPVSTNLNAVCCAENGIVYIVGDEGTMFFGTDAAWRIVDTRGIGNIQDVRDFAGRVFVATDSSLHELIQGELRPVPELADGAVTCLHLQRGDDGLVSIGPKNLLVLDNGAWKTLV